MQSLDINAIVTAAAGTDAAIATKSIPIKGSDDECQIVFDGSYCWGSASQCFWRVPACAAQAGAVPTCRHLSSNAVCDRNLQQANAANSRSFKCALTAARLHHRTAPRQSGNSIQRVVSESIFAVTT